MGFQVTRYHDICAGHRVVGHEGKCRNLHGHNYRIFFTVEPYKETLDSVGRVLDFSVINTQLCQWLENEWDHRMLIWERDPLLDTPFGVGLANLDPLIVVVPFNPTAENIAKYLVEVVGPLQLKRTVCRLVKVVVEETRKCSASYEVEK